MKGLQHSPRRGVTRPAMDRITRIHELLQAGKFPSSRTLAREFEVVSRTVKRDIDFMKVRMDLPIEFDVRRNGYYYSCPVRHLPQLPVSEAELFSLLVAHKAIAQYRGTPFEQPLQSAFCRLTGQLDRSVDLSPGSLDSVLSFHPFAPGDADLETFEILTRALRQHRGLKFLYRNRGAAQRQWREVQPYHLACIQNQWYLIAFDLKRREIRTFALARLASASITADRFQVPRTFNPEEYLAGSFSVFKGGDDYEVVVDLDAWAADEVRGRRWHRTQELTELPGGGLRLRLRLNNIEEVEQWILSMGTHATVVRPKALADRLRTTGEEFLRRYAESPK